MSQVLAWRPTKRQLEVIAECSIARLDTARTASILGIDEATFLAWTKRLALAVAEEERAMAAFVARPGRVAHEPAEISAFRGGLP
jgi:hypothetical protein